MAGNTSPIFPEVPKVSWNTTPTTAANTTMDGTSGTVYDITPIIGPDGARVDQILIRALGSNAASLMRFFMNNGGSIATAANNCLLHEVALPATTVSQTAIMAGIDVAIADDDGTYKCPIPYIPPGHKLFVTMGTAVATGYRVSVAYGEY